ncbi:MAG: hypothetical protein ACK4IY_10125, partial [Chitinophagales bacterium]
MKRLITSIFTVFITIYAIGQAPIVSNTAKQMPARGNAAIDLEQPAFYKNHQANALVGSNQGSSRGGVEFIAIGTAYNLYTILLESQGQVSYMPAINSVAFVHRQNAGSPGGSGALSYDLSTDGGATWVTNNVITPAFVAGTSGMNGNRYPSGALWNPSGNTNPSNAYYVTHGPTLTPVTGSWGATIRGSQKLDGTNTSEVYYSQDNASGDYFPYAIQAYGSESLWDAKSMLAGDVFYVNEVTFNGTDAFDWNENEIAPAWYILSDATAATASSCQVAFNEAGTIGYAIFLGSLAT